MYNGYVSLHVLRGNFFNNNFLSNQIRYRELIEQKSTEKELKKNYRNYIPKDIKKHYLLVIKQRIGEFLDNIKHKSHDRL